jgi:hypothetical protein
MKARRVEIRTAMLSKDAKIGRRAPRLTKRHKTNFRATVLEKEGRIRVQPTASNKDEEIDLTSAISKSTDQAEVKSFLSEGPFTKHRDLKPSTTLSRKEHQIRKQLVRERKLLRRLEEKEKERLEEGEWSYNRTTMLGQYAKIGGRVPLLKKRPKMSPRATGFGREEKTGIPSTMVKSKKKAAAELADLEMILSLTCGEKKRLIGWLDLLESWEMKTRKRLEKVP